MKIIEQRKKNDLLIPCACGGNHFLRLMFDNDLDDGIAVSLIDKPCSISSRIKDAINFIFHGDDSLCCGCILLNLKDIKKIEGLFEKYKIEVITLKVKNNK